MKFPAVGLLGNAMVMGLPAPASYPLTDCEPTRAMATPSPHQVGVRMVFEVERVVRGALCPVVTGETVARPERHPARVGELRVPLGLRGDVRVRALGL